MKYQSTKFGFELFLNTSLLWNYNMEMFFIALGESGDEAARGEIKHQQFLQNFEK